MSLDGLSRSRANGEFVQSLERGLAVIRVFDVNHARLTLAEASRLTGLTRATVRRVLHTLAALGYVSTDGKSFELTPRVLDLGYAYLSSLNVGDIAQPLAPAGTTGSIAVRGEPAGPEMGTVRIRRGHMALLPRHAAYRFEAATTSVLLQQTCLGDDTVERWADICLS